MKIYLDNNLGVTNVEQEELTQDTIGYNILKVYIPNAVLTPYDTFTCYYGALLQNGRKVGWFAMEARTSSDADYEANYTLYKATLEQCIVSVEGKVYIGCQVLLGNSGNATLIKKNTAVVQFNVRKSVAINNDILVLDTDQTTTDVLESYKNLLENALTTYATKATTYTKTEVDSALALKADKSDTYTKQESDNTFAPKTTAITHTGNQLQDYSGNNIYPIVAGRSGTVLVGTLNIDTTNLTISSTNIQYNTNDYNANIVLANQSVSYLSNSYPQYIFFNRNTNAIIVCDSVSEGSDLTNAQNNSKMYLIAILYNKNLTFTLSGNYIYIDNVKFNEIITNNSLLNNDNVNTATHYPFVKYSNTTKGIYQKAIINIVFTSYTTTNLALEVIYRNANIGNVIHNVTLRNLDDNTQVMLLNVLSSNYTEKVRNTFNVGGFSGYFDIDWSVIPNGTYQSFTGDRPKILPICFKDLDGLNIDYAIPSTIPVVVNREIRLEYYNMYKCNNIDMYTTYLSVRNTAIQNLKTALKIKTTAAGNTSETITFNNDKETLLSKTFTIKSVSDATKPSIKAMFIGDSFTEAGYYLAELKTLMGDNLTLYGTRTSTRENSLNENVTTNHEGRSSWSASNYVNDASKNNVTNPFYNDGFDFSYYMTNNPTFNDVTDVFILLGQNDYGNTFITNMQTICNSIKSYNSNIKIHIMLPTPPIRSGYAWGIRNSSNVLTHKNSMFNYAKQLITTFESTSGYSVIATNLNVDCWYDFPRTEVSANMRNPELIEVGNDNVHPNRYGYYRLADMIYADIIANS